MLCNFQSQEHRVPCNLVCSLFLSEALGYFLSPRESVLLDVFLFIIVKREKNVLAFCSAVQEPGKQVSFHLGAQEEDANSRRVIGTQSSCVEGRGFLVVAGGAVWDEDGLYVYHNIA